MYQIKASLTDRNFDRLQEEVNEHTINEQRRNVTVALNKLLDKLINYEELEKKAIEITGEKSLKDIFKI